MHPTATTYMMPGRRGFVARYGRVVAFLARLQQTPTRMLLVSFLGLIAVGALLLSLPAATPGLGRATLVDALFTATSAVCVTGLIVHDTATFWTPFGQTVIIVLIQLGGLGIMTLSAAVSVVLGRRISLRQRTGMSDIMDLTLAHRMRGILRTIVLSTLAIEGVGALALFLLFIPHYPNVKCALLSAGFHSVSAFCNAGFGLHTDNLTAFRGNVPVNLVVMGLIVVGGLGFVVITDLLEAWSQRRPFRRLSLQSQLVLVTTAICIFVGGTLVWCAERRGALADLPFFEGWLAALFQSVSARTAGFNTVDLAKFAPSGVFVMVLLMMIGASPGSTGGGMKTTTVAIAAGSVWASFRNQGDVIFFRRQVRRETVRRALTLLVAYVFMMNSALFVLTVTHAFPFPDALFETASALGTVGLSTGVTPQLTVLGRLLISAVMLAGRLGPLTLAVALATPQRRAMVRYAEESVMVG